MSTFSALKNKWREVAKPILWRGFKYLVIANAFFAVSETHIRSQVSCEAKSYPSSGLILGGFGFGTNLIEKHTAINFRDRVGASLFMLTVPGEILGMAVGKSLKGCTALPVEKWKQASLPQNGLR
jgi:hypothetical protein